MTLNKKQKNCIISFGLLFIVLLFFIVLVPNIALASQISDTAAGVLKGFATTAGYGNPPQGGLTAVIGNIIKVILGFVGVLFLILTIYGGFIWMTAGGNEESIKKAKGIITNSVIGLVIVLAAYAITSFVVTNVLGTAGIPTPPPGQ